MVVVFNIFSFSLLTSCFYQLISLLLSRLWEARRTAYGACVPPASPYPTLQ